jgi:hypothetical protein
MFTSRAESLCANVSGIFWGKTKTKKKKGRCSVFFQNFTIFRIEFRLLLLFSNAKQKFNTTRQLSRIYPQRILKLGLRVRHTSRQALAFFPSVPALLCMLFRHVGWCVYTKLRHYHKKKLLLHCRNGALNLESHQFLFSFHLLQ